MLYRHELNELLARSDLGVRIANTGDDQGRIVVHDGDALGDAVDDALSSAPAAYADEVAHAVSLPLPYPGRGVNAVGHRQPRRRARAHRALLKGELLSKDEGALFMIANEFDIRHRKAGQRGDYDPAFLEWLFHWYLATVSLTEALLERGR